MTLLKLYQLNPERFGLWTDIAYLVLKYFVLIIPLIFRYNEKHVCNVLLKTWARLLPKHAFSPLNGMDFQNDGVPAEWLRSGQVPGRSEPNWLNGFQQWKYKNSKNGFKITKKKLERHKKYF